MCCPRLSLRAKQPQGFSHHFTDRLLVAISLTDFTNSENFTVLELDTTGDNSQEIKPEPDPGEDGNRVAPAPDPGLTPTTTTAPDLQALSARED